MSKVLVTGGSGFIGSNLCRLLHESGHSVLSLDLKESSPKPWGVVVADIREFQVPNDIEIIIHLAAQISVAHSVTEPEETFSIKER